MATKTPSQRLTDIFREVDPFGPPKTTAPPKRKTAPPMPRSMAKIIKEIEDNPAMNAGIKLLESREEFDKTKRRLVGIANDPKARLYFEEEMDQIWTDNTTRDADEVVVGGGIHAAIYCTVRKDEAKNKPLVIEKRRAGGAFAASRMPSFFLNSRNRPGNLSVPGQPGALNVLPGAPIQPSDLSNEEYQRNTDLAFCVRVTLAMSANMLYGEVAAVQKNGPGSARKYRVVLSNGDEITTDRVIFATGVGTRRPLNASQKLKDQKLPEGAMYFEEFMEKMGDEVFPLKGLKKVAVIGSGDSARVAVEALVGQGPGGRWSAVSMDYVERIDWYGVEPNNRERWIQCNRSRYQGLGRLFPRVNASRFEGDSRLKTIDQRVTEVTGGYDCVYVKGVPYDLVVIANGYINRTRQAGDDWKPALLPEGSVFRAFADSPNRPIAGRIQDEDIFFIGPCADFDATRDEVNAEGSVRVPENTASIWRWAPLTASFASVVNRGIESIDAAKKAKSNYLGLDNIGRNINIGDIVSVVRREGNATVYDNSYRGAVVGFALDDPDFIVVDFKDDDGNRVSGGFISSDPAYKGVYLYGVAPKDLAIYSYGPNGGSGDEFGVNQ